MKDIETHHPLSDHIDSPVYMLFRREINEKYAERRVDFNYEGFVAAQLLAERELTPADILVDIGSSSGAIASQAALDSRTDASVICVEKDEDATEAYRALRPELHDRVFYVQGDGEQLPFATSSVQGVSMHNVIFRAKNAAGMLEEARRVVKPGGSIVLSTNARNHASKRHGFESLVAAETRNRTGVDIDIPKPPAEGKYLENIPELVHRVGGLALIDRLYVPQDTRAIITPGQRYFDYVHSIKFSLASTKKVPPRARIVWRQVVDELVAPQILAEIEQSARSTDPLRERIGPYFADTIMRGMFVLQVTK